MKRTLFLFALAFYGCTFVFLLLPKTPLMIICSISGICFLLWYVLRKKISFRLLPILLAAIFLGSTRTCIAQIQNDPLKNLSSDIVYTAQGLITDVRTSYSGNTVYQIYGTLLGEDINIRGSFEISSQQNLGTPVGEVFSGSIVVYPSETAFDRITTLSYGNKLSGFLLDGTITHAEKGQYPIRRTVSLLRQSVKDHLLFSVPAEYSDLITAILTGDKSSLDIHLRQSLPRAGVIHLLCVSGLHVSILQGLVAAVCEKLGLPKKIACIFLFLSGFLLAAVCSFSASVLRALIMSIFILVGSLLRRRSDSLTSLGAAAVFILLLSPYSAVSLGFVLSFGAALSIILFYEKTRQLLLCALTVLHIPPRRILTSIISVCAVTLSASMITFPITCFQFGYIPILSFVSNLIAAPFVPLLIAGGVACLLLSVFMLYPAARLVGSITGFIGKLLFAVCDVIGSWRFSTISAVWLPTVMLVVLICVAFVILIVKKCSVRAVCAWICLSVSLLSFCFLCEQTYNARHIELVTIADSESLILLRHNHAVLIFPQTDAYSSRQLASYLSLRGVDHIDAIVTDDGAKIHMTYLDPLCKNTIFLCSKESIAAYESLGYTCADADTANLFVLGAAKIHAEKDLARITIGEHTIYKKARASIEVYEKSAIIVDESGRFRCEDQTVTLSRKPVYSVYNEQAFCFGIP